MSTETQHQAPRLVARFPSPTGQEIVTSLKPPTQFAHATFENYRPDENYASQEVARQTLRNFVAGQKPATSKGGGFFGFGKKKAEPQEDSYTTTKPGVYLDGGFGVRKTHLLAAAWHNAKGKKYFGSFLEYTSLVGALGFQGTVNALSGAALICIDEFELDDPGDTMIMTRLIKELTATGTKFLATSNTPPNALGEGRFAAQDFLREIQAMSDRFLTLRIDGEDYRQRDLKGDCISLQADEYRFSLADAIASGDRITDDSFTELIDHLGKIHPSAYSRLVEGVNVIGLTDVRELTDQTKALRFVAFIDRVYDAQIPIKATGVPLNYIFAGGMIEGGYRKKYLRCVSRLNALTHEQL